MGLVGFNEKSIYCHLGKCTELSTITTRRVRGVATHRIGFGYRLIQRLGVGKMSLRTHISIGM